MASFEQAIKHVLENEGDQFTITKAGEVVKYGINIGTLRRCRYAGTDEQLKEIVKNMTVQGASHIYECEYWMLPPPHVMGAMTAVREQAVANKLLDMFVLDGHTAAVKVLQRCLIGAGFDVRVDGIFGPLTILAVNRVNPGSLVQNLADHWKRKLAGEADEKILAARTAEEGRYWAQVKRGWMKRAEWLGEA